MLSIGAGKILKSKAKQNALTNKVKGASLAAVASSKSSNTGSNSEYDTWSPTPIKTETWTPPPSTYETWTPPKSAPVQTWTPPKSTTKVGTQSATEIRERRKAASSVLRQMYAEAEQDAYARRDAIKKQYGVYQAPSEPYPIPRIYKGADGSSVEYRRLPD